MRILITIGHPGDVHFFRYLIIQLKKDGHQVMVLSLDKGIIPRLLDAYHIRYCLARERYHGLLGTVYTQIKYEYELYTLTKKFDPDILLGTGGTAIAHVGKLYGKPSIVFTDTEHAIIQNMLTFPFANVICAPSCFNKDIGRKQVRYNGYHELAYLHPNYFNPDPSVLGELGLQKYDKFVIVRFVAWRAIHDVGQKGLSLFDKRTLIAEIEKHGGRVLITSETVLPEEFKKYRIMIHPEKIHDLLYYATLYVGEGATMASECAVLGTPAIYINTQKLGYLQEQEEKYDLVFNFQEAVSAIRKAAELLSDQGLKHEWAKRRERLLADKIDVTQFMFELVESYL